jgi:hypothetical protein
VGTAVGEGSPGEVVTGVVDGFPGAVSGTELAPEDGGGPTGTGAAPNEATLNATGTGPTEPVRGSSLLNLPALAGDAPIERPASTGVAKVDPATTVVKTADVEAKNTAVGKNSRRTVVEAYRQRDPQQPKSDSATVTVVNPWLANSQRRANQW